jgi:hypothetical protein
VGEGSVSSAHKHGLIVATFCVVGLMRLGAAVAHRVLAVQNHQLVTVTYEGVVSLVDTLGNHCQGADVIATGLLLVELHAEGISLEHAGV